MLAKLFESDTIRNYTDHVTKHAFYVGVPWLRIVENVNQGLTARQQGGLSYDSIYPSFAASP